MPCTPERQVSPARTDCAVVIVEHNCVAIERGLRMGLLCLLLWQEQKDYRPSETVSDKLDKAGL